MVTYAQSVFADQEEVGDSKPIAQEAEWKNLIEGDNLSLWKKWRRGTIEESKGWSIKDGVLHLSKSPYLEGKGGSIITIKPYQNFEFKSWF